MEFVDMSSAVINRLDYQEPAFRVENINLVFNLDPVTTTVYNTMRIEPLTDSDHDLVLNGSELELASVFENGSPLSTERYTVTPEALIIRGIRQKTTITIYNKFHPQANTLLSGIYMSNGNFMSQCESEGFRRITRTC
jgi:aminopeptidase N